jgi:penicillin-insensitive murein DD-endopeptidase
MLRLLDRVGATLGWIGSARLGLAALLLALLPVAASAEDLVLRDPWARVLTPASGRAQVFGDYTHGCLVGGEALPPRGPGFAVLRLERHRNYGHPELLSFIERLGRNVQAAGLPAFYVGDMAQPRGGPMPSGHAAHEIGMEADIYFVLDATLHLTSAAEESLDLPSMLLANYHEIDRREFGPKQIELLKLAATDPRVARIFVNPVIKEAVCRSALGSTPDERAWMRVLRPWFGHAAHFHVRLHCPPGSPTCQEQKAPPPGDGCGAELHSWLRHLPPPPPENRPHALPVLPAACHRVLSER